ncbi:MAG TPA: ANTAR domain-containing protein [Nocardioides sp.]|nr:ANTAR domain-containing protein [Nocardioides sp.]
MEFIRETLEAFDELDPLLDDGSLFEQLSRTAADVKSIAPNLAGMSLASSTHGLTFTLVATDDEIAALDAVQYLDTGPCVEAFEHGQGVATTEGGLLDERRWHDLAVASAAAGVRSTLTFPVKERGDTVGSVNLYGRTEDTFVGKHQALADVLHAWAPGAVTNADLSFSTIEEARRAPERLRDEAIVDTATGILAANRRVSLDDARDQLHGAARRAGVPLTRLARAIIDLHNHDV